VVVFGEPVAAAAAVIVETMLCATPAAFATVMVVVVLDTQLKVPLFAAVAKPATVMGTPRSRSNWYLRR